MEFREEFDRIWACASPLHAPHREMDNVMLRFTRALRSGGVFYTSIQESEGERVVEGSSFFRYYTRDSFEEMFS